jgi:tetratricopeptide (TPR) repeat protein
MQKLSIIFSLFCLLPLIIFPADSLLGEDKRVSLIQRSWDYYYKKGELQFRAEMYDYAIENMTRVMDAKPDHFPAANYLGRIYLIKNDKEKAREWFRRSLEINPRQADIHYRTGKLEEFFFDREAALNHYLRAVELDPASDEARAASVRHLLRMGDGEKARTQFREAYHIGLRESAADLERARVLTDRGRTGEALTLYRNIIKKSPALEEAYFEAFRIETAAGNHFQAAELLEELIRIKPDHKQALTYLGNHYFSRIIPRTQSLTRSGDMGRSRKYYLERALWCMNEVTRLDPDNAQAWFTLSDIYHLLDRDQEAEKALKKGLELEN